MKKYLVAELNVGATHRLKIPMEDIKDIPRYQTDDIEKLTDELISDIKLAGINQIKGYKFEENEYDLDNLKVNIIEEE